MNKNQKPTKKKNNKKKTIFTKQITRIKSIKKKNRKNNDVLV